MSERLAYALARIATIAVYATLFMASWSLFSGAGWIVTGAWALAFVLVIKVIHPVTVRLWSEAWDRQQAARHAVTVQRMRAFWVSRGYPVDLP